VIFDNIDKIQQILFKAEKENVKKDTKEKTSCPKTLLTCDPDTVRLRERWWDRARAGNDFQDLWEAASVRCSAEDVYRLKARQVRPWSNRKRRSVLS
jgi:hypothetical protein